MRRLTSSPHAGHIALVEREANRGTPDHPGQQIDPPTAEVQPVQRTVLTTALVGALLLPAPASAAARPDALRVSYSSFRNPVKRRTQASVTVHTGPGLRCSIKVTYADGVIHAAGLGAKQSNGSGRATWTWKVPKATRTGKWPVTVTCQSGGSRGHATRSMSITA
jgi:hypothetical protein